MQAEQQQQPQQPQAGLDQQQQQQQGAAPDAAGPAAPMETDAAAAPLPMDPGAFVDDLVNAVHILCADGIDSLDGVVRAQHLGLTPEQQKVCIDGCSQLHLGLEAELDVQLQKFEAYALETCLHVPAGLLAAPAAAGEGEQEVDEAEEAAADELLAQLRQQIAAAKHHGRKLKADIAQYDAALARYSGSLASLQAVPGALAGKENAVAEDSRVLAAAGLALEGSCAQLERLRAQKAAVERADGGAAAGNDDLAAEKEILRRQAAVQSAPADSLRRLQERLAA